MSYFVHGASKLSVLPIDLHMRGLNKAKVEEISIFCVSSSTGPISSPNNFRRVPTEPSATVIAGSIGHPTEIAPVKAHRIELKIAIFCAREDNPLAVRSDRCL